MHEMGGSHKREPPPPPECPPTCAGGLVAGLQAAQAARGRLQAELVALKEQHAVLQGDYDAKDRDWAELQGRWVGCGGGEGGLAVR